VRERYLLGRRDLDRGAGFGTGVATMSAIAINGNLAEVQFNRFDLEAYDLFLRCKGLPESRLNYAWETDTYTLSTPARFAPLLGVQIDVAPPERLPLPAHLFDYQRFVVERALDAKRYAAWLDTGLGKTAVYLEWARQVLRLTGGRVLILVPLQVIRQIQDEAVRFYGDELQIEHLPSRELLTEWAPRSGPAVGITNYEKFIPGVLPELRHCAGLVADECFARGTLIDTPDGPKPIEDFRIGDQIVNAAGIDEVSDVHRREIPYAIRITIKEQCIISSPNHPYFTRRGWVCAQDLLPGDEVMATAEAVRMVRSFIYPQEAGCYQDSFLREVLLSEMAYEPAGACCKSPYTGSCSQTRRETARMVSIGHAGGTSRNRTHSLPQPDEQFGDASESLPPVENHAPQTFRAWGQRDWFDGATTDLVGCARVDLGSGISFVTGRTDSRLSIELQARLSRARAQNQYRGGWTLALQPESRGRQARYEGPFARVDGLEVLEPGHSDLESLRDANGKFYFYDLGGTRHPSFSVHGCLVHNSSILKSGGGVIKWNLIKSAKGIEYKLSCTATPAPNETMEYASQASFLEKLRTEGDILWTFFTRDKQGNWRVKPHARKAFYEFMASWSIYVRNPANFGWQDILSTLPAPDIREYQLEMTDVQRELMYGFMARQNRGLIVDDRLGIQERSKLSQLAKGFLYDKGRQAARIESVKPVFVADLVRADVADGRQCLVWTVFDVESDILAGELADLPGVATLTGSMSDEARAEVLDRFRAGEVSALISKAQLIGYGMNFQNCRSMVFSGFDDSFERMYQAIRRAVRYGQTESVRVHVPYIPELEGLMLSNVKRKQQQFNEDTAIQERHYCEALGVNHA
jgi:hypothetical protein